MKKYFITLVFAGLFGFTFASDDVAKDNTATTQKTAAIDVKVGDYIAVSTRDDDYISISVYRTKSQDGYYAEANGVKYTVYKNPSYKQRSKNNPRTSCTHYIQHDMWKYYFSI